MVAATAVVVMVVVVAWIETPGRMGKGNGRGKERITPCCSVVITAPDRDGEVGACVYLWG